MKIESEPMPEILEIDLYDDYQSYQTKVRLVYRDSKSSTKSYFEFMVHQELLGSYSLEEVILNAVAAMGSAFLDATYYFLKSNPISTNGASIKPVTHSNKSISNTASNLPGYNVFVKHPPIPEGDIFASCERSDGYLGNLIMHLNDIHKWTREAIADWLDEISDPTGETGPDLRFKEEPAKVEPPAVKSEWSVGWDNQGKYQHGVHVDHDWYMADITGYYPSKPVYHSAVYKANDFYYDEFVKYSKGENKEVTLSFDIKDLNPEILTQLTGESNEQD